MTKKQDTLELDDLYDDTALVVKGAVATNGDGVLHRGDKIGVVALASVAKVAFEDKKGVVTRVHSAVNERAVLVGVELVQDTIDEQEEIATGQMRLLSPAGEIRRAGHLLMERRRVEQFPSEDPDELLDLVHGALQVKIDADSFGSDDPHDGAVAYLSAVLDNAIGAGAVLLQAVEVLRSEINTHLEAKQQAEAEERARIHREAQKAAAVHSDDEHDETAEVSDAPQESPGAPTPDDAGGTSSAAPARRKRGPKAKVDPEAAVASEATAPRSSSVEQRIALGTHLAALDDSQGSEFVGWCKVHGYPTTPGDMTYDQASDCLFFLGDRDASG